MALHHKLMYKVIHQVTNNQLQDQNMADHEQFPVMHIMDYHKMFVENVYHQIHLKDQNRQSIDDAITSEIKVEEEIIINIYHQQCFIIITFALPFSSNRIFSNFRSR